MKVQDHSLMDPDIQETPFAYYDALLAQAPVYYMAEIGAYVISKYKDIQYIVAHPEIWSIDMRGLPAAQLIKHRAAQQILETEGFPRDTKFTTDPPAQYAMQSRRRGSRPRRRSSSGQSINWSTRCAAKRSANSCSNSPGGCRCRSSPTYSVFRMPMPLRSSTGPMYGSSH